MSDRFPHVIALLTMSAWAMRPEVVETVAAVLARRINGERWSDDQINTIKGERHPNGILLAYDPLTAAPIEAASSRARAQAQQAKAIGVINLFGFIGQHASAIDDVSGPGGTSTERLLGALDQAMADQSIGAVILNVDSPGGLVHGVQEAHDKIMSYRGTKPIIAQVNSTSASAAYWLSTAADAVHVTPSGEVGSIGVYMMHKDVSAAAEKEGVKFNLIHAGKYKVEANQFEPLSDDAREYLQANVDRHMTAFVNSVAKGRGATVDRVRSDFGQGRMIGAQDAVRVGMADRVQTLEQTIRGLAKSMHSRGPRAAMVDAEAVATAVQQAAAVAITKEALQEAVAEQTNALRAELADIRSFMEGLKEQSQKSNAFLEGAVPQDRPKTKCWDDMTDEERKQRAAEAKAAGWGIPPVADTSPLMKVCDQCGCNYDATGEPGMMNGNDGVERKAADGMPTQEHRQSSKMEKCPDCGAMREPTTNRDGKAANDSGPDLAAVERDRKFRERWRARRRITKIAAGR